MALTISESERQLIMPITAPAFANLALTNDFFSWQKEYDQFKKDAKATYMVNGVWILMQKHSTTIEGAKQMLRDKIAGYCQEYLRLKTEFQSSKVVSTDVRRYLSALELSIAGNVGWSQFSPRYQFSRNAATGNGLQNGFHSSASGANGHRPAIEARVNGSKQSKIMPPPTSSVCAKCNEHNVTSSEDQIEEFSSFPPSEVDPGDMIPSPVSEVDRHEDMKVLICRSLPELSDEVIFVLDRRI